MEKGRREKGGKKVQRLKSIIGRYKIDRGRFRTLYEMEKPKNLYVQPMDMEDAGGRAVQGRGGKRGRKKWDNCNIIINKIYFKKILV